MAETPARMRPIDHILAHALTAIVTMRVHDAGRYAMLREVLEHDCRGLESTIPQVRSLDLAARQLLAATTVTGIARAEIDAADAVQRFSEWRLGLALAAKQASGA